MTYDLEVLAMGRVTDACGLEATGYGGYDSLVHTMYPALHQACGMPPGGRLTGLASTWLSTVSFPAAPALYLLGTLLLKQTAAFFCPWVWSHWLLLFSQSPKRQPLPVAEVALGPMW